MMDIMDTMEERNGFQAARTATVVRALDLARRCTGAPAGRGGPSGAADALSSELAHHLLPHLESDARLATAIPGAQGTALATELAGQREELGSLIEALDRVLLDAVRPPRAPVLRRTLEAAVRLLERHLVTEGQLWEALAGTASEQTLSTLSREAEATERGAQRALRFVWHPPASPTEAKALWWTSPKTRRVFVLDAAGASGLRDATGPGPAVKEAP